MRHPQFYPLGLIVVTAAVIIVAGLWWHSRHKPTPAIPVSISNQLSFVAYLPGADWSTPPTTLTYQHSVLTIHSSQAGTNLTISEQATPDIFNDVPNYYSTVVTKLNQYASLSTANGTAYLTKPKELNGQQQVVLNNDGTLMFVHPSKDLSNDNWRRFFNGLQVIKPH